MDRQILMQASAVAARSLRANIRAITDTDGRRLSLLTAGREQHGSIWTRDFCFAAGGLLAAGETGTVRDTLEQLISRQREDGLFPRLLDSYGSLTRFARAAFGHRIPLKAPLAPNFVSDHFVTPIDSNALIVWTAARYALKTDRLAWAMEQLPRLERAMDYYQDFFADGLIIQPPFSDWKDTVGARRGAVFFTQLLYWKALVSLSELYAAMGRDADAEERRSRARAFARGTHRVFWNDEAGFFSDTRARQRFSADGNLAAVVWDFADERQASRIIRAMDRRGQRTPWGPRAAENYPLGGKSWLSLLAGVSGYQDAFVWLWTSALAMRALHKLGRENTLNELVENIARLLINSGQVSEIYRPEDGTEVSTWLYKSDAPFSWSAGMLLEAFAALTTEKPRQTAAEAT